MSMPTYWTESTHHSLAAADGFRYQQRGRAMPCGCRAAEGERRPFRERKGRLVKRCGRGACGVQSAAASPRGSSASAACAALPSTAIFGSQPSQDGIHQL